MTAITITNAGRNLYRDAASGANKLQITYVALGSSSTTPTASDTKLGNETFRKKVTSATNGGSAGEILITMYLGSADAIGSNIQEVGFFAGNAATSHANTGVLVAHGLYAHSPKTGAESIQFTLDLTAS